MPTFYLDMDGVCADFDTAAEQFLGIDPVRDPIRGHYKLTESQWDILKTQSSFYRDLPLMDLSQSLVNLARCYRDQLGWNLLFLTAVPKDLDMPWAFWDKCLWAQTHWPDIPVMFGPLSRDKWRHCSQGDILVDDRPDNCLSWRAQGGLAFQVQGRSLDSVLSAIREDLSLRVSEQARQRILLDLY